jgi:streptogramin lyase
MAGRDHASRPVSRWNSNFGKLSRYAARTLRAPTYRIGRLIMRVILSIAILAALLPLMGGECAGMAMTPAGTTLLDTLELDDSPVALVVDPDSGRAFFTDGRAIGRLELLTRQRLPRTISEKGVFYIIDSDDLLIGEVDPDKGRVTRYIPYPTDFVNRNVGIPTGMTFDPATSMLYVIDDASLGRAAALFEIDPRTGARRQIGENGLGVGLGSVFGLALDPTTGLMYTTVVTDSLWRIDPVAATAEEIGPLGFTNVQGLAFTPDGQLYGWHATNEPNPIVRIDKTTGAATEAFRVPLTYTAGALAFAGDGTLWTVDLPRNALIRVNPSDGRIEQEFTTLERAVTGTSEILFQHVNGMAFAPDAPPDQTVDASFAVDSLGIADDGGVLVAAGGEIRHFKGDFDPADEQLRYDLLDDYHNIVRHPVTGDAFVFDGLGGVVQQFKGSDLNAVQSFQFRPESRSFAPPNQPSMGIDPDTNQLFFVGDFTLYVLSLDSGETRTVDAVAGEADGVIVDAGRRRIHVNARLGCGPGASCIKTLDADTLEEVNVIPSGVQIFAMAFDPARNRIAANVRFVIPDLITTVVLYDAETGDVIPFDVAINDDGPALDALLGIDPVNNQLLLGVGGDRPRLEFHRLPD